MRAASLALADFFGPVPQVDRVDATLALPGRELKVRTYSPLGAREAELPGLVYFHGGGCVSGSLETHDGVGAWLSDAAHCRIVAVEYRLAPEARFPAPLDDAFEAFMAIAADPSRWRMFPARLGLGGDSAGAHLAALAARRAVDAGTLPALLFLLCPVIDLLGRTASRRDLARDHLIDEATMESYWDFCRVEGLSPDDPGLAPLKARLDGLPRALIHTGQYDPLRDEGADYARALTSAGGRVEHVEHAGLIHHFYGLAGVIPAAKAAKERIGEGLRAALA